MFKRSFFTLLAAGALAMAIVTLPPGCYYDNEEDLYGPTECDTASMSYATHIQPILQAQCYSCHSNSNNIAGFTFDDYDALKEYANNGSLVNRINDASNPMPPSGLMPECDRQQIEAWVKAGALNN